MAIQRERFALVTKAHQALVTRGQAGVGAESGRWRLAVQASSIASRGSCGGCLGGLGHLRLRKLFAEMRDSHTCAVPQCHIL